MDTEIQFLLSDFAAVLRSVCRDPDLSVLLYNPPAENCDLLLAASDQCAIPEFAGEPAAAEFVRTRLPGRTRSADEPRRHTSADGHSIVLEVPFARLASRVAGLGDHGLERRQFAPPLAGGVPEGCFCIGASALTPIQTLIRLLRLDSDDNAHLDAEEITPDYVLSDLLALAARLICRVFDRARSLRDPVSLLPGRIEYESALKNVLAQARENQQPLGVLLINPDDFVMVNHRFGREQGDSVLREIAQRLKNCVRDSDGIFRCGGAVFGLVLPATSLASVNKAAAKFQSALSDEAYLDSQLELTFTVGGATVGVEDLTLETLTPINVIRQAEHALHKAKLAGDGGILLTSIAESIDDLNHFHPSSGVFTSDSEKDYRNMLLLWESVAMVSSVPDPVTLAQAFVDRLHARFWTDRVTLVHCDDEEDFTVLASRSRDAVEDDGSFELDSADTLLVGKALMAREMERVSETVAGEETSRLTYALPLIAAEEIVGCLVISGKESLLYLDATDLIFLNALSNQVAMALDRFALSAKQLRVTEKEKRRLRQEVRELRHALNHTKLVYESDIMKELMGTLQRVASSDATILITGESGTGKEMLAHAVHEFSDRCGNPLVTVDCGAITHTLLEAELFGHRKGAYTGADIAHDGRIVHADGGTLFLDEVGELPLDVQAKLLRFVQEREITPVGGSVTRRVDVRIIAATNRDLEQEVAAGRFREDLYYRLQVVTLRAAPLRERREDILPIARFFLEKFAAEHGSSCASLREDAQRVLLSHNWPGNVRELQHCILRSVLMSDDDSLGAGGIYLRSEELGSARDAVPPHLAEGCARLPLEVPAVKADSTFDKVRVCLIDQLEDALRNNPDHPVPIGRWLQEDLVLMVSAHNDNVGRRAARMIGVPESTFRRQLDKARADLSAGIAARSDAWRSVSVVLELLVSEAARGDSQGLLEDVRLILLDIVKARTIGRPAVGAALMGVTPPTYKRWLTSGECAA